MTSFIKFSPLLLVLVVLAISVTATQKLGDSEWTCKGEKPQAEYISKEVEKTCRKEVGEEVEKEKRPGTKLHVCAWEKQGVLSDNKVSEEGLKKVLKKLFPTNGQALSDYVYDSCITKTPSNVANLSKDDDYKSYDPLVICVFKKLDQFCRKQQE